MKKLTKPQLEKKLDRIFSQWIRQSVIITDGVVKCVTCGKLDHYKSMHCGHFVGRQHRATRWDEKNCHVQCPGCNTFREGNKDEYAVFLVNEYGPTILDELNRKKHSIAKWETFELENMIKHYQERLNGLKNAPDSI